MEQTSFLGFILIFLSEIVPFFPLLHYQILGDPNPN